MSEPALAYSHQRIILLLNLQIGYCRRAIRGIAAFASKKKWLLEELPATTESVALFTQIAPAGVIAHVLDKDFGQILERVDCPVVSISSNQEELNLPSIDADQAAVGRLAAEYFWELGYRAFAYFGSATASFSMQRERGYSDFLESHGIAVRTNHIDYTLRAPFERNVVNAPDSIGEWLADLPKPIAMLCSNDEHAHMISSICQIRGYAIPDEISVLGVDNDETFCSLSSPSLSSVDNPGEEIGYRAAIMLDEMIQNGGVASSQRIQPIHIIERASTQRFASEDEEITAILSIIERNLRDPTLSVETIAEKADCSRRSLERKISRKLGMTVLNIIHRSRVGKAKSLLRDTTIPLTTIASECGFSNYRRLGVVFQSITNMAPSDFRKFYEFDRVGG